MNLETDLKKISFRRSFQHYVFFNILHFVITLPISSNSECPKYLPWDRQG